MPDRTILKVLADNQALFDAVKETLKDAFSLDTLQTTSTNEELGAKVRSRIDGLAAIERAFTEIARHRTGAQERRSTNPGR